MICGSGGSKSRLAKAAGAELAGQMRDEKLHAVVARSTFRSQNVQNTPRSDHFWKLRCRKSARRCSAKHISKSKCTKHTRSGPLLAVALSKKCTPLWRESHFGSQNVQNTPGLDHFWQLRCWKSARRCGAKHISKSKCAKHTTFGPLLEVEMSKKCTPLWREAHFEVKMIKTPGFGPLLEVQMSKKCMRLWREVHFEVKMLKTLGVRTIFGGSDVASLHYTTLHYTTLHYATLHYITLHSSTLHYTTLDSSTLHYTEWHYTTLHYTTLRSTTLHYITLHYTTVHATTLHYTILWYYNIFHYTSLPYTTLHSITLTTTTTTQLHSTTLNYTTTNYIALHYIPPHSTTPHYITLHYITLNDTAPQIDR